MAVIVRVFLLAFFGFHVAATAQTGGLLSGAAGSGRALLNPMLIESGSYTTVNFVKQCGSLQSSMVMWPSLLNVNGYFTASPTSSAFCNSNTPVSYAAAAYYVAWSGTAGSGSTYGFQVSAGANAPVVINGGGGSAFVVSAANGTVRMTGTDGALLMTFSAPISTMQISFTANTPSVINFTNIAICRADQVASAAACLAGQSNTTSPYCPGRTFKSDIFNPDWLCFQRQANARALRPLQWTSLWTNSDWTAWFKYQNNIDSMTYASSSPTFPPGLWAGASCAQTTTGPCAGLSGTGGANVFVANNPPDASCSTLNCGYVNNEQVTVYSVDASTTATATLELRGAGGVGRGAKVIKKNTGGAIGSGAVASSSMWTYTYNAILDAWLVSSLANVGFIGNVPVAVQARACQILSMDCHFNIPTWFEPSQAALMATAIAGELLPPNRVSPEYSNEPWLTGSQWSWGCTIGEQLAMPQSCNPYAAGFVCSQFRNQYGNGFYPAWPADRRSQLMGKVTFFVLADLTVDRDVCLKGSTLTFDSSGFYTQGVSAASIVGSISPTTSGGRSIGQLTISSVVSGAVQAGQLITGAVATNTRVLSGAGTSWLVNNSQTVSGGTSMTLASNAIAKDWSVSPNRPFDFMTPGTNGVVIPGAISTANYYNGVNLTNNDVAYTQVQNQSPSVCCYTVTAISNGNPGKITATNINGTWQNGDRVILGGTIGGMPTFQNAWVTVANLGTGGNASNQFDMTSCINASAAALSCDTTAAGTYTSGGLTQRQTPAVNAALLTAADDYASGDATRIRKAFQWVLDDLTSGTRPDANGTPYNTGSLAFYQTLATNWQATFGSLNLETWFYEGSYDAVRMNTSTAVLLGIDAPGCSPASSCYGGAGGKIDLLLSGFKGSDYARNGLNNLYQAISSTITKGHPAQFEDISKTNNEWILVFGDLYTALLAPPYTTLGAFANFNAGLP